MSPVANGVMTGVFARINSGDPLPATLSVHVDSIDVTCLTEADPNWTFVDAAGHYHAYSSNKEDRYPTLETKERPEEPAAEEAEPEPEVDESPDDTWFPSDDDDYAETYRACRLCGEEIRPAWRPGTPTQIAGLRSTEVEVFGGELPDLFQPVSLVITGPDQKVKAFGIARAVSATAMGSHIVPTNVESRYVFERVAQR